MLWLVTSLCFFPFYCTIFYYYVWTERGKLHYTHQHHLTKLPSLSSVVVSSVHANFPHTVWRSVCAEGPRRICSRVFSIEPSVSQGQKNTSSRTAKSYFKTWSFARCEFKYNIKKNLGFVGKENRSRILLFSLFLVLLSGKFIILFFFILVCFTFRGRLWDSSLYNFIWICVN